MKGITCNRCAVDGLHKPDALSSQRACAAGVQDTQTGGSRHGPAVHDEPVGQGRIVTQMGVHDQGAAADVVGDGKRLESRLRTGRHEPHDARVGQSLHGGIAAHVPDAAAVYRDTVDRTLPRAHRAGPLTAARQTDVDAAAVGSQHVARQERVRGVQGDALRLVRLPWDASRVGSRLRSKQDSAGVVAAGSGHHGRVLNGDVVISTPDEKPHAIVGLEVAAVGQYDRVDALRLVAHALHAVCVLTRHHDLRVAQRNSRVAGANASKQLHASRVCGLAIQLGMDSVDARPVGGPERHSPCAGHVHRDAIQRNVGTALGGARPYRIGGFGQHMRADGGNRRWRRVILRKRIQAGLSCTQRAPLNLRRSVDSANPEPAGVNIHVLSVDHMVGPRDDTVSYCDGLATNRHVIE